MYGIRQCNRIFLSGEIGAFFTEIFFQISVVILNSNLHYQIFKFVIDNSDISLNCLQHIQKRRIFDAKVTCHQPICLLLHAILSKWSRSGVTPVDMGHTSSKQAQAAVAPCNLYALNLWEFSSTHNQTCSDSEYTFVSNSILI